MKPVWYDHNADNPPWIKALADVRRMGTLEGYCYFHVQTIMLAIDQYAETASGNREYFLNKPHSGLVDSIALKKSWNIRRSWRLILGQ